MPTLPTAEANILMQTNAPSSCFTFPEDLIPIGDSSILRYLIC
jgi:hypothetical protein